MPYQITATEQVKELLKKSRLIDNTNLSDGKGIIGVLINTGNYFEFGENRFSNDDRLVFEKINIGVLEEILKKKNYL